MKQHGPWKIKSSEVKYKNPWIEVREDSVLQPNGTPSIYGTVRLLDGVSVLALDKEDRAHLAREFRYAIGDYSLEAVSGAIDSGESPLTCAKRELKEELGIVAQSWTDLGRVHPLTGTIAAEAHLFLAQDLVLGKSVPEVTEVIEEVVVPFDELVEMIMQSKVTHGPSCALILKAARYLGKL